MIYCIRVLLAAACVWLFGTAFSGLSAQTISAPASVNAGAPVNVQIQGSFDARDFVTIVAKDAPDGSYDRYKYARSASITLTAPEVAGDYEIRMLDDASPYPTLHQLALTVNPVTASLQAPASISIGESFDIAWQGPDNDRDFITIVPKGAAERKYGKYTYTKRGNPAKLTAPTEPGTYEVRYLTAAKFFTLASVDIEVTDVAASLSFASPAGIGTTLEITWTGPGNQPDFITVVPAGAGRNRYTQYAYPHRNNPVELRLPETPGEYEIRYLIDAEGGGYRILASEPLLISAGDASVSGPSEAVAGSSIQVSWSGPDNDRDFITVVPADAADTNYDHYAYTNKGSPLELLLPEQPGDYELRYLTGHERQPLARQAITVLPASASLTAPASVEAGTAFEVTWEGPGNQRDYIAASDVGSHADYHTYSYTRRGNPVTIKAPDEPGEYELHYVTGQDRQSLAKLALTVTPSRVPGTLRVVSGGGTPTSQISTFGAVELILDASGSMLQQLDGQRRIAIAKQTLDHLVNNLLPANSQYALRVFGHRQPDACDTELLQPLGPLNRSAASTVIGSIEAKNLARTPIADSLAQVGNDLAGVEGEALVILVTDGEETCDGDPAQAIADLRASGFDVRVNIIGFAIDEYALKQEFARWAELGGGAYFDANNADALTSAMQQSLEVTYSVYDGQGQNVASGTVNGVELYLPAGDYEVRVGEQRHAVTIEPEEENIVAL